MDNQQQNCKKPGKTDQNVQMFLLFVKAAQTIQTASLPILALSGEDLNSVTSSSVIFGIKYVISRVHFCIRIQKIKIEK